MSCPAKALALGSEAETIWPEAVRQEADSIVPFMTGLTQLWR
jgi:hypothetical protein